MRRHCGQVIASAVLLCVAVGGLRTLPLEVFWHPDEGAKFLAMRSLRWEHGITYDAPYRGRGIDPQLRFYAGRCGYSVIYPTADGPAGAKNYWPIAFPLLSRPLFDLFGFSGLYFLPLLAGWLTALARQGVLAAAPYMIVSSYVLAEAWTRRTPLPSWHPSLFGCRGT